MNQTGQISQLTHNPNPFTVTVDYKNSELVHDLIETLQYVANTTTCEQTKLYLTERLDLLTKH